MPFSIVILVAATLSSPAVAKTPAEAGELRPASMSGLPSGDSALVKERLLEWQSHQRPRQSHPPTLVRLRRPLAAGLLTSSFGSRAEPMRGATRDHRGIDVAAPYGSPIFASGNGIVEFAGLAGSYGNLIKISHGDDIETRYGHLSEIAVSAGDAIKAGDLIGFVGSSGRSTGSHLHFEIRVAGTAVNPALPLSTGLRSDRAQDDEAPVVSARWQGFVRTNDKLPSAY